MIDPLWFWLVPALLLDLVFSAARSSLGHARQTHLMILREQNPAAVDRTMVVLSRPRLVVSLRLVMIFMHFLFAGLVLVLVDHQATQALGQTGALLGLNPLGVLVLLLAGALLLMTEYAIEGRLLLNPEQWAMRLAPLGAAIDFLFTPISALLMSLSGYSSRQRELSAVTDDELKVWVEEGQSEGSLEHGERKMIYSIFQFGETLAREIMVPRIDIVALDIESTFAQAIQSLAQSGHSRLPVFENTIDNIVGLLYAKDLLGTGVPESESIRTKDHLLRPVYFVPEAKKVDQLLAEMQARRVHMAVVVDEYGGVAGLVTLEDILEEIIGEIQDEYDQAEEMLYQQVGDDEYIFHGRIDLDDFNDVMGVKLPKEAADTLGGYMYGHLGRVPTGGETLPSDGLVLTVEQVLGRRIRKVRARRVQTVEPVEVEPTDVNTDG